MMSINFNDDYNDEIILLLPFSLKSSLIYGYLKAIK